MSLALALCGAITTTVLPIWPRVLGYDSHINESQPRQTMQIVTEYFINREKYFYLILLHKNIVFCIGATTLTATGTMLLGYVIYACAIFRTAR